MVGAGSAGLYSTTLELWKCAGLYTVVHRKGGAKSTIFLFAFSDVQCCGFPAREFNAWQVVITEYYKNNKRK